MTARSPLASSLPIMQIGGHRYAPKKYRYSISTNPAGVKITRRGVMGWFTKPTVRLLTDRRMAVHDFSHVVVHDPVLNIPPFTATSVSTMIVQMWEFLTLYPADAKAVLGEEGTAYAAALMRLDITMNEMCGFSEDIRAALWAVRGEVQTLHLGLQSLRRRVLGLEVPAEDTGYDNGLTPILPSHSESQ